MCIKTEKNNPSPLTGMSKISGPPDNGGSKLIWSPQTQTLMFYVLE